MRKGVGYSVMFAFVAATVLTVGGCRSLQQPVKVFAGPVELEQLTGDWVGEYSSRTTGRSGTILFVLTAGKDTAYGNVVMVVPQLDFPNAPAGDNQTPSVRWRSVQSLGISFVAVDHGLVRGTLDPYIDPICHCTVTTTFEGRLEGDTIVGTYTSTNGPLLTPVTGVWKVVRRQSRPNI